MDWCDQPVINLADLEDDDEENAKVLEVARGRFHLGPVVQQCGTWAVTEYGLECLTDYYPIEKTALFAKDANPHHDWPRHMATKRWVNMVDFLEAFAVARKHHQSSRLRSVKSNRAHPKRRQSQPVSPSLRFLVLRRDGYRCCLCGRTATDGAILEVDHRIPLAKGGPTLEANLWTLCFACNRGKATRSL